MVVLSRLTHSALLMFVVYGTRGANASLYSDSVLNTSPTAPAAYYRLDETSLSTAVNSGTAGSAVDATYLNLGAGAGPLNIGQLGPRPGDIAGGYLIDGFDNANNAMHLAINGNDFPRAQVAESGGNALDITGALTLEAWIRRDAQANAGNNEGIVAKYQGSTFGNNRSYALYYDPRSGGRAGLVLSDSGANQTQYDLKTATDLPLDQWVHIAATYDPGTRIAIYVNGQLSSETTNPANIPSFMFDSAADFWIGQQFDVGPAFTFEGRIDEVAVYPAALTAVQIAAHFAAATGNTVVLSGWSPNSSGNWNTAANWKAGTVPNSNTAAIEFGTAITASKVVYTESNVTVKSIRFDNANKYAVAGTGTITLAADSGNASIQVLRGAQEFQAPVTLGSNTDVTIAAGSLLFNNTLNLGGRTLHIVSGTVTLNGAVLPGAGGQIANIGGSLGSGSSSLDFGGDFTNSGTLNVSLGGTQPGEFSTFNFSGDAVLAGLLNVAPSNGFALTPGDTFTVITAGNLVDNGIALSGLLADELNLNVVGNSVVLSAGLLGDFNGDSSVDSADYLTWRKGLGTRFTQSDYNLWRLNFGATGGTSSFSTASVPEPSAALLFVTMLVAVLVTRRSHDASPLVGGSQRVAMLAVVFTVALAASAVKAGPYSTAVLADNPVAYYRLGETSGSTAVNSSTNGVTLDGTYTNFGASSLIGQSGPRAGDFSGVNTITGFESDNIGILSAANTNAQVDVSDNSLLDMSGAFTLEAWVRRSDTQAANANSEGIVGKFVSTSPFTEQRSFVLYYNSRLTGTGNQSIGFIVNGSTSLTGSSTPGQSNNNVDLNTGVNLPTGSAGGWTHLAAVYVPGTSMSVYMNGVSIGEKTTGVPVTSPFDSSAPLWIGRQFNATTSTAFEGLIDEVAVYSQALSPSQIATHYAAAATNTPATYDWAPNSSGSWHSPSNWSPGITFVPSGPQVGINLGSAITSPKTVYTESNLITKSITFNNANKYAVAGVGTISLTSTGSNSAALQVVQGEHEFQAPISLGSNTSVNVTSGAGNSLTFNNSLTLNAKTLSIDSGAVNINHSVLAGSGGTGVIVNTVSGTLGTAGSTSIAATLTSLGTLDIDLGGTDANQFSAFNITGTATISGSVRPELVGGFTLSPGNTFTILSATSLSTSGLTLTGPLAGLLSLTKVGNTLVLTSTGLPGDFNHDSKVDAADYVTWRKGLGTTYTQTDYNTWRANFGATGGSGSLAGSAVPELSTMALLALVAPMFLGQLRGFRR